MKSSFPRLGLESVSFIRRGMKAFWIAAFFGVPVTSGRLALSLGTLLLTGTMWAQSAGGRVEGRVLNATSGKYLNSARVAIEGTTLAVFTDQQGHYQFSNVPLGEVTV